MNREIVDILLEAIGSLPDLPETMVTALVEGAHALTGGTKTYRPLTAEETEAVVKFLKANAAGAGIPFDEEFCRRDILRHPGKYQETLGKVRKHQVMPTRSEIAAKQQQSIARKNMEAANKAVRFKYYRALIGRLKKSFSYYNIPFDEAKAMDEITKDDARWAASTWLKDAVDNPSFVSLGAAMKDPAASFLRRRNPALGKFIQDAFNFRNMDEAGLEKKKAEYRYMKGTDATPEPAKGAPGNPQQSDPAIDNRIAPWFSNDKSIGDIISRCKGIPYDYLYQFFIDHGAANKVQNAPKPGEDAVSFLSRCIDETGSVMDFTTELNRIAEAAFGKTGIEKAVNDIKTAHPREYAEMYEKCSQSMVKPRDLPLYAAWSTLHMK